MVFYFIFLFRFYSLFFSYLWDNYKTLLITVLFIRTDRLSPINIRVIIIIIIIRYLTAALDSKLDLLLSVHLQTLTMFDFTVTPALNYEWRILSPLQNRITGIKNKPGW